MKWLRDMLGITQLEQRAEQAERSQAAAAEALSAANAQLHAIAEEKRLAAEKAAMIIEPNVTVRSSGIAPDGQVRLELDWNDEFIEHLKEQGYTGTDDEDLVNQWLNSMMMRFQRPDIIENGAQHLDNERYGE